ncbi:MAG: hypothetical protein KJO24_06740 [Gammaproteobacteria bacterium]|nr:hypothetical protein [Gammaproteobacteria bacterium]
MLPPILSYSRALLAGLSIGCLSACSSLNYGVERVAGWADAKASTLWPAAEVRRERQYPVSSEAPLFVQGDDPRLVNALAQELDAYFSAVTALPAGQEVSGDGFALVIRALHAGSLRSGHSGSGSGSDSVHSGSGNASTADVVGSGAGSLAAATPTQAPVGRQLNIRITDRYSNSTFDQINIDLHTAAPGNSTQGQHHIRRALRQAAAMLAGQS